MTNLPEDRSVGLDPADSMHTGLGNPMSNTVPSTRPTHAIDPSPEALTSTFIPVKGFTVGSADTFPPADEVYEAGVVVVVHVDGVDIDASHQYVIPLDLAYAFMERLAEVVAREMAP